MNLKAHRTYFNLETHLQKGAKTPEKVFALITLRDNTGKEMKGASLGTATEAKVMHELYKLITYTIYIFYF